MSSNTNFHSEKNINRSMTFIPNLFKINTSKSQKASPDDPFITDDAGQEYCSVLSKREDEMPNYLHHFKSFTENVLDNISDDVLDDIAKMHIERELKFREEEKREEELLAQQQAIEMKTKSQLDKRVTSIMKANRYYVKRSCPVKIPFKSTLTHEEHEFYLRAFIKFQIWPPSNSLEQRDYEQYLSLQNKVFDEQTCLMNFSYKVSQLMLKEYNATPSAIDDYISSYVSHRCERALSYPSHYKIAIEIPLKPQDHKTTDNFQLRHIGHLLSLGWIPCLKLPPPHTKLAKDESVAEKRNPDCDRAFDRKTYLYKCSVSEDPNAEYLARVHKASIVMSSSAFKTIVDNQEQTYDKDWNIPLKIKSYKTKDEGGKERDTRIVFLDKPLSQKTWLPLQKKFTFFKASAKAQLLKVITQPFFRMAQPRTSPHPNHKPVVYDNPFDENTSNDSENDFFGAYSTPSTPPPTQNKGLKRELSPLPTDIANDLLLSDDDDEELKVHEAKKPPSNIMYPPPSSYHHKEQVKVKKKPVQAVPTPPPVEAGVASSKKEKQESEVGGLLDNLLSKQDTLLKPKVGDGPSKETAPVPSSLSNYDTNADKNTKEPPKNPWSDTLETNWDGYEIKPCPGGAGVNVHYQLFSFECTEQSPVKTERVDPIRIIVRHNIHGLTWFNKKGQGRYQQDQKRSKAYVVFPKVENQVFFGCEVNSLSEIVQQWAALAVRPHTTLFQTRVCVDSGAIVMSEEKTLESILKDGKQNHLQFNPQTVFSTLNILFNTCFKMCSGDYLLHHSPKTKAFINLLKAADFDSSMCCLDLHKAYSDGAVLSRQYNAAPWLAIDTHVVTPFHMFHKKIPATFPMQMTRKLGRDERKKKTEAANKKMTIE